MFSAIHPLVSRREFVQVGYSGLLGLGMMSGTRAHAAPAPSSGSSSRKQKSLIVVWLTGGPGQHDTLDPKPDAPVEIRGEFGTIATPIAGVRISEHLPRVARRLNHFAVVRSLAHRENNHLVATHNVLTGHPQPGAFFDKIASRDDWPSFSSTLSYLRPRTDGIPVGVNLPTFLVEGPLTWPGQHAGFLGPKFDPWQITQDPNSPKFAVENLRPAGMGVDQLKDRMALLDSINRQQQWLGETVEGKQLTDRQQKAVSVLTSGRVAAAFEIEKESPATRDRYGRHAFGQSLLLARRLVEAGVTVVHANMGRVQNWDLHGNNFNRLKNELLPPLDRGLAALIDDLADSGQLDDTMVMVLGEFGRTPKVGAQNGGAADGRDHWAACFSGLFAGGGVRGGQVIGKSDKIAAYPTTTPYSPEDIGATVYHVLGIDPGMEIRDRFDRPVTLNRGRVIEPLFTAAS